MRAYSNDLRARVVAAMEAGGSCREVGRSFSIAPSTAGNWYRRYRETRSHAAKAMGGDRRWKLAKEVDWLAQRLAETPDLTLAEVQSDLAARGTHVSYAAVCRTVKRLGLRFRKNDICK